MTEKTVAIANDFFDTYLEAIEALIQQQALAEKIIEVNEKMADKKKLFFKAVISDEPANKFQSKNIAHWKKMEEAFTQFLEQSTELNKRILQSQTLSEEELKHYRDFAVSTTGFVLKPAKTIS